ncbi:translation initiation factor IF-2 [Candidatus Micrarchaeota archaeon]|nr:translation initiation factor IF-2 [Candidatus Micrarchaeota archaeon]
MLRQPIVCILGHVDHGKTSLLDALRETRVAAREVGHITQHIGASEVPLEAIETFCKPVLSRLPLKFTIPGLLFIDTPGHDAFTNLRRRGGSIADIAILVIDCTKGIEPQTIEAIQILKEYKTPFLVAFNKVDAMSGWKATSLPFSESVKRQLPHVAEELDSRVYNLIGQLYQYGFNAERFDRVTDFTKQLLIVPVSAKSKEGLSELMLYVAGLAQKFLEKRLELHPDQQAMGSILEVKEERGLGKTLDVILYDGILSTGDSVAFLTSEGPRTGTVKALLKPQAMDEMRDPKHKFTSVKTVHAACGVKIAAENADDAVAGSSFFGVTEGAQQAAMEKLKEEYTHLVFENESHGVVLKADSLGSLEAITKLFSNSGIAIKRAGIGKLTKNDVTLASAIRHNDPFLGVLFSFHQPADADILQLAEKEKVKVFQESIIYNLIEGYQRWRDAEEAGLKKEAFSSLTLPAKIRVLPGHCFRVSNPCIVGIEVLEGRLRKGYTLINGKGQTVATVRGLQEDKKSVDEAIKGKQVAASLDGPVFGRQINENDELYSDVDKETAKTLEGKYAAALTPGEKDTLTQIKKIKGFIAFGQ